MLGWAAFIVYGSWVPLNFQPREFLPIWAELWHLPSAGVLQGQRLDTAVNVLLTMPLGFGLALLWAGPVSRAPGLVRAGIVLLMVPLSVAVEVGQGVLPSRNPSLGDVLAQAVGTTLGLCLQALFGRRV